MTITFEPLDIIGIVTNEVGSPKNDGSRGSGLYAVPIQLSRRVSSDEADLLKALWDRPPSFTSMHRPGIARVHGDRFVLDGTTMEEVGQYHAKTVRLVVDRFNVQVPILLREDADRQRAVAEAETRHRREVEEQASRVRFDR